MKEGDDDLVVGASLGAADGNEVVGACDGAALVISSVGMREGESDGAGVVTIGDEVGANEVNDI